jgi:hypothetical protein
VVAVDIGSVRPSKFAWAAFDTAGRDLVNSGTNPESAVSALVPGLRAGYPGGAAAGGTDVCAGPRRPARCVARAG